jgi:hypothetical protein
MKRLVIYNSVRCNFCNKSYPKQLYIPHLRGCKNYIYYLYNKFKTKQIEYKPTYISNPGSFEKFITNKRIIIVGPSVTTSKCNLGEFIDNFDIIVRLNKSLPIPEHMKIHIGSRTDILYNSLNRTDDPGKNNFQPYFLKKNNVKFLRCSYPPIKPFLTDIQHYYRRHKNNFNFSHIDTDYYNKLERNIRTRPYTGTCAIADLLKYKIKELFVIGIDFYTYKYLSTYQNISSVKLLQLRRNRFHERRPQIELIRRFYLLDNRITVDDVLKNILLENYNYIIKLIKKQINIDRIFVNGKGQYLKQDCNKKICIVGNTGEIKNNFDNIDWIIDIFSERKNKIRKHNIKYVCKELKDSSDKIIFLKSYNNIPEKFKKVNYFFINSNFTQILKRIFTNTIFSSKSLTLELFVILTYSIFFNNVYISNINPNKNWISDKYNQQHAIAQRMLFQYLVKSKKIKFV